MAKDSNAVSAAELERIIKDAAGKSRTTVEARRNVMGQFSPEPLVWVVHKGLQCEVFIRPPNGDLHSVICDLQR